MDARSPLDRQDLLSCGGSSGSLANLRYIRSEFRFRCETETEIARERQRVEVADWEEFLGFGYIAILGHHHNGIWPEVK